MLRWSHQRHGAAPVAVDIPPVQVQNGSVDYGLFAIAFAYEIVSGNRVLKDANFDQMKMRVLRGSACHVCQLRSLGDEYKMNNRTDKQWAVTDSFKL